MLKVSFVIVAALVSMFSAEGFKYIHCCEYPELVDHSIGSNCPLNATSDDHKAKMKAHSCQLNCIAREMNLLNEKDHIFSPTKFGELVDKMASNSSEAQSFYKEKLKECIAKVNEQAQKHKSEGHGDTACSMKVSGVMMCLGIKVALDCPDDKKIQSDECNHQRERFQKMHQRMEKHGEDE